MTQLDTIPFRGDDLLVANVDGQPYIVLKPAYENIGLAANKQIDKVQSQSWARTTVTVVRGADGRPRQMIAADVRTFLMSLATITASRVSESVRPKLEQYQAEVADVIEAYYVRGMAPINPRLAEEQVPAVVEQAIQDYRTERERQIAESEAEQRARASVSTARLELLQAAASSGLVDLGWVRTKAQVQIAAGLGEAPAIPDNELPLYVEDYLKSKGLSRDIIRRFASAFGRKVAAEALLMGVKVPGKRQHETSSGDLRPVKAWTKGHLPVFDSAWARSGYAEKLAA